MTRKIAIFFLLILPASAAYTQILDCGKFRVGKFRIADTRAGVVTIAERKGMYQTESSEALKAVVRFKISWHDNCSYTLRLDKVLRNENRIDFPAGLEVKVRITETHEGGYTQATSSSLTNGTYNVAVTKIN